MTKNNVKANIWKLYMIFEANKEFMENLSLQRLSEMRLSTQRLARRSFAPFQTKSPKSPFLCGNRSPIPCMVIVPAQKLSIVNIGLN